MQTIGQTIIRHTLLSGVAAAMLMAGTAHGQTTTEPAAPGTQTTIPGQTVEQGATAPAAALTLPPERTGELDEGVRSLRTEDLEGMDVYSIDGEEVGSVEGLVRHNDQAHLVVSLGTGWFNWGGGDRVAIPVEHFESTQDGLLVQLTEAQAAALEEYVSQIDDEQMTQYDTVGDAYTLPR